MQHWLLHAVKLNPAAAIHATVALELIGELSRRSLRAALDHSVSRHQALRTVFRLIGGVPVSVVGPADHGFSLLEQDVVAEDEALFLLRQEARLPFDVSTGPLIRARLLQLRGDRHFLIVSAHPLVCDRESLASILSEVRDLYVMFSRGAVDGLPRALTYSDFVLHQFDALRPDILQGQLSYWKRQLLGAQDLARLPTDRPRPAIQLYSTKKHRFGLSEALTGNLGRLAAQEAVSLMAVLLGGWGVLLSRWSGQRDVTIGMQASNRPCSPGGSLIGQFENILPIRVTISPSTTVATLLARVHAALSAAAANQDVPIHAIDESLRALRGGRPIIQTAISLSRASLDAMLGGTLPSGELEVRGIWEERSESSLEIAISVAPGGGRLLATVEYAQELFDVSTIERVCGWWVSLFSAMARAPGSRVSRLTMLPAAEREAVISEFNSAYFSIPHPQRIDDVFESTVELAPDAVAVVDGLRTLTFGKLNGRANQLARVIRRRGGGFGELIAVPSTPGIEAVVASIAVLKAGGAYIAGGPAELRSSSLRRRERHALRMFIVIQRSQIAARVDDCQIIALDADADEISKQSVENLQRGDTNAGDLACAVSSVDFRGQRRWMLLDHRNITSTLASLDERLHFTRFDVWSLAYSMASGTALLELWGALLYGSQVTVATADLTRDPWRWRDFLGERGVTVVNQQPSDFLRFVATAGLPTGHRIHTVILSGEPLRATTLKAWLDLRHRWPQVVYVHGHRGPSVAGPYSEVRQVAIQNSRGMLAGEPLSCFRCYILDRYRRVAPIGVEGDIYIAGDAVARGYIDRRNYSEWVPDPFIVDGNARLYKTGDRGFWTAEGKIEFVFRRSATNLDVEAARIEGQLLSHPAVKHASVVVSRNEAGDDSFLAYVEGIQRTPSPDELRNYLERSLPAYMVPKEFLRQEKMAAK